MLYYIIYQFTNKVNRKVYVGQTVHSLSERMSGHVYSAMKKHSNSYFHRAIRKYGIENFESKIIFECNDKLIANIMETFKIMVCHSHVSEGGYNLTWGGEDNPMNHPEIRLKSSKSLQTSMKRFVGKNNVMKRPDIKVKHQKAIDILIKTDDWITVNKKCNEEQKGMYEITDPDGSVFIILGLSEFCKNHGLQQSKMSLVAFGKREHHKGYKCKLIKHNKKGGHTKRVGTKTYCIETPEGKLFNINNLPLFCKEHNLSYASMLSVFKGRQKQHKGFKIQIPL